MDYTHIPVISCFYADKIDNSISKQSVLHPEAHFEYQMILVLEGRATAVINQKSYALKKGSLLFISRLERHNFIIEEEPYHRFIVSLNSASLISNLKNIELMSIFIGRPQHFNHAVDLEENLLNTLTPLFQLMSEEYQAKEVFFEAQCASAITTILIQLYRAHPEFFPVRSKNNVSSAVINAQIYINDNFEKHITLQAIADQNYINRHTLSSAFKEIVGISFKEYLILFRLTEAKRLLITTDLSIEEIARQVGYTNVNNFIHIFKKKESATPLQFRKHYDPNLTNKY